MHIYAITRGHRPNVQQFIHDIEAQAWQFPHGPMNPISKERANIVQTGVRPIQFWEFVIPYIDCEENLQVFLSTIAPTPHKITSKEEFFLKRIRKFLHAEPVPKYDPNGPRRFVRSIHVECTPIGIKSDILHPKDGYEML